MVKIALLFVSFVSFVVGASIGFPSGIHMSAMVQSVSAADIMWGEYDPPVVTPLDPKLARKGTRVGGNVGSMRLDGINCLDCVFADSTFEYGGGAINCPNCQFPSKEKTIVFTGAALNTVRLLQYFQSVNAAPQLPPWLKEENPKIEIKLTPQTPKTMDLVILTPPR
jgi:hypothetical protein